MRLLISTVYLVLMVVLLSCSHNPSRDPAAALDRIREADIRRNILFLDRVPLSYESRELLYLLRERPKRRARYLH